MSDLTKYFNDAIAALNNKDLQRSEELFKRIIKRDKSNVAALNLLVVVLISMERFAEAEPFIAKATAIDQNSYASFSNYGLISKRLNKPEQALKTYGRALELSPNNPEAWNNRGTVYNDLGQYDLALADFDRAISLDGSRAAAHANRGKTLSLLKRHAEALSSYQKALSINPHLAEVWLGLGYVFSELNRYDEARAAYDRTLSLNPDLAEAWVDLAHALFELKRYDEALAACDKALSLNSNLASIEGVRLHTKMRLCKWENLSDEIDHLTKSVRSGKDSCYPFALLSLSNSPEDQLRCARSRVATKIKPAAKSMWDGAVYAHERIRLGYVSSDLNRHPVAQLTAELFELHDRKRFEVSAYSIGPDDGSDIRKRLMIAFDKFVPFENKTDIEIARAIADAEIDILIDLNGFTKGARTGIFAHRPAPIQVNYLGYPGTMAAPYIDYIIGDQTILTDADVAAYSEKLVKLPCSYQPNDRTRAISSHPFERRDFGLPADQFVFCCFNNNFKITPETFERWMRILRAVEGSVLWLLAEDQTAIKNLGKEAEIRGVDSARLVFANRMEPADHLARHRLADLFLDTLPYNAHTTASDALWAGLPVLTQIGETFAGRVAASLLKAVGLPELITHSSEEYEGLAIEIARHPETLRALKKKLAENRLGAPLFDTERLTRQIEAAYIAMHGRYRAGLAPDTIVVAN